MKTSNRKFAVSATWLAVQGALLAMCATPLVAMAQDDTDEEALAYKAMMAPTKYVELGAEYVSKDAPKFGEYNGLNKSGGYALANFALQGGNALGMGGGTTRWDLYGTDLGTTSREVGGRVSNQGQWSLGLDFDQLRHYTTGGTYQTPFQGSMGGNNFTLPTSFGVINTNGGVPTLPPPAPPPSNPNKAGTDFLTANQKASFRTQDVHNNRDNTSFNAGYIFDPHWNVKFDYNHLEQSGAKLLGVAGDQRNATAGFTWAGQTPLVLMNPTNYTTNNINLALNWIGDQGHASLSYYGSAFHDGYNGLSWNNPFEKSAISNSTKTGTPPGAGFPVDTMSTMPGNQFHQLNLSGGYAFSSATKLAGGLSYGRNRQNDTYSDSGLVQPADLLQNSLDGLVVTTHADLKLTHQTTKDLLLSAGLKFNKRDNQTASNTYTWTHINTAGPGGETAVNIPMSNKKTQLELAGDYHIDKDQKLRLSYEYEKIDRWCNNAAANNGPSNFSNLAYWGGTAYTPTTCAEVPNSKENKLAANYKLKVNENVNVNAGYGYSDRKADFNPAFYNPMQADGEGFEVPGFRAFFQASRKEQMLKAGLNWQPLEKLSFGLNGRYTDDHYDDVTYGVQKGNSWSLNLDATYSYTQKSSVFAYLTSQNSRRDMTNLASTITAPSAATVTALNVPVGASWNNELKENDITFGLGTKYGGLMGGKLDLAGDLTYSLGKTGYGTQFNYAAATLSYLGVTSTCASAFFLTCGDAPDIKNEQVQLKLSGDYQLSKVSKVVMGYMFQHLKSNDFLYNTYQFDNTPSALLPTNQLAPKYNVNVIFAAYNYSFE